MGRGPTDDPRFFSYAGAAGVVRGDGPAGTGGDGVVHLDPEILLARRRVPGPLLLVGGAGLELERLVAHALEVRLDGRFGSKR